MDADLLEAAWGIIANAGVHHGGWDSQHPEWVEAAIRWRDRYHEWLRDESQRRLDENPELSTRIDEFLADPSKGVRRGRPIRHEDVDD